MINLADVIGWKWPGAVWTLSGNDYSGLVWQDSVMPIPTQSEVAQAMLDYQTALGAERTIRRANWKVVHGKSVQEQIDFMAAQLDLM